jgi:hypothetical protein
MAYDISRSGGLRERLHEKEKDTRETLPIKGKKGPGKRGGKKYSKVIHSKILAISRFSFERRI